MLRAQAVENEEATIVPGGPCTVNSLRAWRVRVFEGEKKTVETRRFFTQVREITRSGFLDAQFSEPAERLEFVQRLFGQLAWSIVHGVAAGNVAADLTQFIRSYGSNPNLMRFDDTARLRRMLRTRLRASTRSWDEVQLHAVVVVALCKLQDALITPAPEVLQV